MEVAIYFDNGNTAYFKEVDNFNVEGNLMTFNYYGVASQKSKSAKFDLAKLAGYSITRNK